MIESFTFDDLNASVESIRRRYDGTPRVGIVLGSGLGDLADRVESKTVIPYREIVGFPTTTVEGHSGNLVLGKLAGVETAILQGRFHYYEGRSLASATAPIRTIAGLGAKTVVLTAAAGGVDPKIVPGSIVSITDHMNLIGENPLRGPNDARLGPRFPDMSEVYSARLRGLAIDAARETGIELGFGVYAAVAGPSYETPAEIKMLRVLGADLVGMSVAPEAIVARHMGLEVAAFAIVSNHAAGVSKNPITHAEVLEAGKIAAPKLGVLVARFVAKIAATDR
jgi:purine-nucleoside phosphorylase